MGLSHPPGWDNISPDVKFGGYSCRKREKKQLQIRYEARPPEETRIEARPPEETTTSSEATGS